MPAAFSQEDVARLLRLLGITPERFGEPLRIRDPVARDSCLAGLKQQARRAFHKAALELHPDRHGGDPEKTARFRELSEFHTWVQGLQVQVRQPVRPRVAIVWPQNPNGGFWNGTETATAGSGVTWHSVWPSELVEVEWP